jgi:tetratricopeptide (TPR) repeat protein
MKIIRAAACALLFVAAASSQAACRIQVMELPVHMEGGRAISMLGINGTQMPVIVDTGAFFSMLTRATADQLSHHIYVSIDNDRMYFTYNGGPVFARNVEAKAEAAAPAASPVADGLTADALFRRGTAFLARRDVEAALADLDRACWIDSHHDDVKVSAARNSRCWDRMQANVELDQAVADCDDAIDDESDDASFRDSRGWLRLRLNQPARAKADFDRALRIDPALAWSLYGRALAHLRLNEAAPAQADLAAARKAEPAIDEKVKAAGLETVPAP